MRTRRSVLVSVGGMMALAGCSQQSGQPAEESDTEGATDEFGIDQFQVEGERPDEYDAEFIAGSSPESVADELTPELGYQISGASGEVETQVRYEYSDATIPEGEPLDQTVEGETHEGGGEYSQTPSMPDSLVSEVVENPKNLVVTFRATDSGSDGQASREYELNFADSFGEQIITRGFEELSYDGTLNDITVENESVNIVYDSSHEIGSEEFNFELGGMTGLYSGLVEDARVGYQLHIQIEDTNGDTYNRNIENDLSTSYLNGNISHDVMENEITFNRLQTG